MSFQNACFALAVSVSLFGGKCRAQSGSELRGMLKSALDSQQVSQNYQYAGSSSVSASGFGKKSSLELTFSVSRQGHDLQIVSVRDAVGSRKHVKQTTFNSSLAADAIQRIKNGTPLPEEYSAGNIQVANRESERERILSLIFEYGFWLDGYVATGSSRAVELLLESNELESAPAIGQHQSEDVVFMKGQTEYGEITVGLDRQRQWLPVFCRVSKSAGDLVMKDLLVSEIPVDPAFERESVRQWVATADSIDFTAVGESWMATSGTMVVQQEFQGGGKHESRYSVNRKDFNLMPEFDENSFVPDIIVGSTVRFLDDQSGVQYQWDGNGVQKVSSEVSKPVPGVFGGGLGLRMFFVLIVILILAAVWFLLLKRAQQE